MFYYGPTYVKTLYRKNNILRQRLYLSKRDNRCNRDKLRSQIQKLQKYGFTDEQVCNLYIELAKVILNGLKRFKVINKNSYPMVFNSIEDWHKTIDNMIWAFEQIVKDEIIIDKQCNKQILEGLELFAKYFRNLWD